MRRPHPYLLRGRPRLRLADGGGCGCAEPPALKAKPAVAPTAPLKQPPGVLLTLVNATPIDPPRTVTLRRS